MNIQRMTFLNPGGRPINNILAASRVRFLDVREVEVLMLHIDDFPQADAPVPPLRRGLYRRDSNEYTDENAWIVVGPGQSVTRSRTLRRNGEVVFNYIEARRFVDANTLIRRTIRRRGNWQLHTLVHYLVLPGNVL